MRRWCYTPLCVGPPLFHSLYFNQFAFFKIVDKKCLSFPLLEITSRANSHSTNNTTLANTLCTSHRSASAAISQSQPSANVVGYVCPTLLHTPLCSASAHEPIVLALRQAPPLTQKSLSIHHEHEQRPLQLPTNRQQPIRQSQPPQTPRNNRPSRTQWTIRPSSLFLRRSIYRRLDRR